MPEKYTPTIDELRSLYVVECWEDSSKTRDEVAAEFDRAIAKAKADAVREAAQMLDVAPPYTPTDTLDAEVHQIRTLRDYADRLEREG